MNPLLILLAAAFVILMMVFGHNPARDAKEKREKALAGRDPLIAAIEEHNQGHQAMQNWFVGGGAGTQQSPIPSGLLGGFNKGVQTTRPYQQPVYPPYMLKPGATAYPQQYQQGQQPAATPPPQGYYPPPPLQPGQQPRSDAGQGMSIPMLSPVSKPLYLRSGQKVAFLNTSVYTYDSKGKLVPLPDGKYAMFDGRVTITVKGGKKIIY